MDAEVLKGRLGQAVTIAGLLLLAGFVWFTDVRQVEQCHSTSDYEACLQFARDNDDQATARWIDANRLP